MRLYTYNPNAFEVENEFSFYWAGFLAADGSIIGRDGRMLCLSLKSNDKYHIERLANFIETNAPVKTRTGKAGLLLGRYSNSTEFSILRVTATKIANSLKKFNIVQRKTYTYKMSDFIMHSKYLKDFIRGYFDGDGNFSVISKSGKIQCWSICGTYDFINQIRFCINLCCGFNYDSGSVWKQQNIYRLQYSSHKEMNVLCKWLWLDSHISLDRKSLTARNCIKQSDTYLNKFDREKILNLYLEHKSCDVVAKIYGCSRGLVYKICKKNNISMSDHSKTGKRITESKRLNLDYKKLKILRSKYNNISLSKFCENVCVQFNCSPDTVRNYMKEYNLCGKNV